MGRKRGNGEVVRDAQADRAVFMENLRFLVNQFQSIAEASRILSINRQQLNKYLNGSSFPSLMTLQKIASYFDVDPTALIADHDALTVMVKDQREMSQVTLPDAFLQSSNALLNRIASSSSRLEYFLGDYLEYTRKSNSDEILIASFSRVYEHNGIVFQKTLSPYLRIGDQPRTMRIVKHDAVLLEVGGLIHFLRAINVETMIGTVGMKVINPAFGESPRYVRGLLLATEGVKAGRSCYFPVLMKKIVTENILETLRENCGPFALDDVRLDPAVREAFRNSTQIYPDHAVGRFPSTIP